MVRIVPKTFDVGLKHIREIEMENIMRGFKEPKILDLKIGHTHVCRDELKRQGYGFFARTIRKIWAKIKNWYTGANIRGWRICGGTGVKGNKLTRGTNSENELKNFFKRYDIAAKQIDYLREEILKIKNVVKKSDYAFVDSSILVVIDKKKINVKLIDFAYAIKSSEAEQECIKHRKSFDIGIDNLITEISKLSTTHSKKI